MGLFAVLRGGGDLASGVVLRLVRCGIQVVVTELPRPLAVRRRVAFAQAVYDRQIDIEGIPAVLAGIDEISGLLRQGAVPVVVDPDAEVVRWLPVDVVVDGRMAKKPPEPELLDPNKLIGLGPGFTAGVDCRAVVETKRGPFLGRVYWQGTAEPDSGLPDPVWDHQSDRVLRAPADGILRTYAEICDPIPAGGRIASVDGQPVLAPFDGRLRGLLMDGLEVSKGLKIGDLDPRDDPRLCTLVSDKALAVGGGVLEAVLSMQELRARL